MDLESAQNNVVAKLPLLKQGDYEMWKLRIEQYFQVQDYTLWDVTKNGNSFNPASRIIANTYVVAQSSLAVASLCISSGNLSSLAVESCSGSGNTSLPVGMPCAFYSQKSSPKLDAPTAIKFPE
nr:hypothetical protein [Tanacetum cinerariifolium]